jgi:ornithine carbamoyltransferase
MASSTTTMTDWPEDLLSVNDLTCVSLGELLSLAEQMKRDPTGWLDALPGESLACWFARSWEPAAELSGPAAGYRLGMLPILLRADAGSPGDGGSIVDTARALSASTAAVFATTSSQRAITDLARATDPPVVNGRSDEHDPCQVLADLLTLRERFGRLEGLKLAYTGDGNNMAHSLMLLGARAGVEVAVATPPELQPDPAIVALANGKVTLESDPRAAAAGANALYTDVWVSMGDEGEGDRRRALLEPYRLDAALMDAAADDAIALHCLPAHPGEEISEDVLYGDRSAVWDQAENRLHAQKALLELLLEDSG